MQHCRNNIATRIFHIREIALRRIQVKFNILISRFTHYAVRSTLQLFLGIFTKKNFKIDVTVLLLYPLRNKT